MTKTVWIYNEVEYDSYEAAKEVFYEDIHEKVRDKDSDFIDWFNSEYEGCDFDHCNYWTAYEIAEAMDIDFDDYEGDYGYSTIDDVIEEVEKPCGYVFDLDGSDKIYDTEEEARDTAREYASDTFFSWIDTGRYTKVELSAVLANALDGALWNKIYEAYETQCLLHVRTATEADIEESEDE